MDIGKVITKTQNEIRQIDLQMETLKDRKKALNLLIRKLTTVGKHAEQIVGSTVEDDALEDLKNLTVNVKL